MGYPEAAVWASDERFNQEYHHDLASYNVRPTLPTSLSFYPFASRIVLPM